MEESNVKSETETEVMVTRRWKRQGMDSPLKPLKEYMRVLQSFSKCIKSLQILEVKKVGRQPLQCCSSMYNL
jgi:hypothetical protein